MRTQASRASADAGPAGQADEGASREFPVREYIGAMAVELAQMARWDGDEVLGRMLDSAAALAAEPVARSVIESAEPNRPRPA